MHIKELLLKNRSYRRFDQSFGIPAEELRELVDCARLCPSGRNAQALKYVPVCTAGKCSEIFPLLSWAGYLTDWDGPAEGERPSAYLVQLLDTRIVKDCLCDDGLQLQSILLAAVEKGLGGCIIKGFRNKDLRSLLDLPEYLEITYVLALGRPVEQVVLENMQDNDIRYWRDAEAVHHVPKRSLDELIFCPMESGTLDRRSE